MKIAYLETSIPYFRNHTGYRRSRHLSQKNDLYLFLSRNAPVPKEIEDKVTIIRSNFTTIPLFLLWRLYKTWRVGKKVHLDFVYTFYSPFSIIEGFLLKLLGFKWIADIWDHPELHLEVKERGILLKLIQLCVPLARRLLKHADLIICAIMPEALKAYNIDPKKIVPITNGVELECTKPNGGKRSSSNEFKVFYVGFVGKIRGTDTLVKAFSKLDNQIPAKLILAGRMTGYGTEAWLNDFLATHNLQSSVEILGEVAYEKVLALIEEADVCVSPFPRLKGTEHIYPIKIFEYLALGKPVVATNLKGVSQIIKDGENGLLVEPDDPDGMAEAMLRIYEDKELRERLEQNARKSILEYDWDIINKKIDNALDTLKGRVKVGK